MIIADKEKLLRKWDELLLKSAILRNPQTIKLLREIDELTSEIDRVQNLDFDSSLIRGQLCCDRIKKRRQLEKIIYGGKRDGNI